MKKIIDELNAANQRLENTAELRKNLHKRLKRVHLSELEEVYNHVVAILKLKQIIPKQGEFIKTISECVFERIWKHETDIKIYPSFVIGRSPVDFFTPALAKGIVFEIDGEVHKNEWKNIKTNRHEDQLQGIGISVYRASNEETRAPNTRKTIQNLAKLKLTDFRARQRILKRIYIETIGTWVPESKIHQYFSLPNRGNQ